MADPCTRCGGRRGNVAKAGASPVCEACGALAGELTEGMPPRYFVEFTDADRRAVQAVRDLCEATDPRRRAAHLGEWAAAMAERMERAIARAA